MGRFAVQVAPSSSKNHLIACGVLWLTEWLSTYKVYLLAAAGSRTEATAAMPAVSSATRGKSTCFKVICGNGSVWRFLLCYPLHHPMSM